LLLSGLKVAPIAALSVIRSAEVGRVAPRSGRNIVEDREAQRICRRGRRAAPGKLFGPDGCDDRARGAAVPAPGFTGPQGRRRRTAPKGAMANPANAQRQSAGTSLTREKVSRPTTSESDSGHTGRRENSADSVLMSADGPGDGSLVDSTGCSQRDDGTCARRLGAARRSALRRLLIRYTGAAPAAGCKPCR